ncbi:MAG: DUF3800 domain-containing protein [Verrucomicrobiota bacterium JB023]|nr:DUF3800 domain-containing protein [Verrucomicrobiota bacterium JB023]
MKETDFSDYVVYVDESGHASPDRDPNFPCFVLAFCLFQKSSYLRQIVPALQSLKFRFFGHDMVVFHEREIRKALDDFAILKSRKIRDEFHQDLGSLLQAADFSILHHTILKDGRHVPEDNLYHLAAQSCLEGLYEKLVELNQQKGRTHVVFEMRGKAEDRLLELEFRRICDGDNKHQRVYPFSPVFASKKCNSTGLQIADLVARPIGLHALKPEQVNRAYDILATKDLNPTFTQTEFNIP